MRVPARAKPPATPAWNRAEELYSRNTFGTVKAAQTAGYTSAGPNRRPALQPVANAKKGSSRKG